MTDTLDKAAPAHITVEGRIAPKLKHAGKGFAKPEHRASQKAAERLSSINKMEVSVPKIQSSTTRGESSKIVSLLENTSNTICKRKSPWFTWPRIIIKSVQLASSSDLGYFSCDTLSLLIRPLQ